MSEAKKEEWLALAERIEVAARLNLTNREIDGLIGALIYGGRAAHEFTEDHPGARLRKSYGEGTVFFNADPTILALEKVVGHVLIQHYTVMPLLTASLDAITALIEREFPNSKWAARRLEIGAKAMLDPIPAKDKIDPALKTAIYADAETPALALCAVFCRAMAERVPKT